MAANMLTQMENVSVFESGKEYNGIVLGAEGDVFWLLILDLNEIHRGHVYNLHQLPDGKKFLSSAEWITSVEKLFDNSGQFSSDVFWASKNPQTMINVLKKYRLIGGLNTGAA
jgi:hypothetical protein